MRRTLWTVVLAALAGVAGGGCTVGSGAGSGVGPLYVVGCDTRNDVNNYGTFTDPACFDLAPTFFAGTPIEDLTGAVFPSNRLIIRMQTTGYGVNGAYNNTVYGSNIFTIDVLNAYQVARCLRGRCIDGAPDWDTRHVSDLTGGVTDQLWCDWGPNPCAGGVMTDAGVDDAGLSDEGAFSDAGALAAGPPFLPSAETTMCADKAVVQPLVRPLIHLGPLEYITASLQPFATCPTARLTGAAVEGWISFTQFGQAETLTSITPDFKVNFGERLQASFHAILQDDRVVTAINHLQMVMQPQIGGELNGFFDFILDRGRAAQPFP